MSDRIPGVVTGLVTDLDDPQKEGRIRVKFPWLPGEPLSPWAPIAVAFAGGGRGAYFMPEPGDEVLVAFEHGDFNHPYVIGFLWNGMDKPPEQDPRVRVFHSLNGHRIEIYDPDVASGDQGYIRLQDAHGNRVELANARITIQGIGLIHIQAPNVMINSRPVAPVGSPI